MITEDIKYSYVSNVKPVIALITLATATGLIYAVIYIEAIPLIIQIILWVIIALVVLVFFGSLIRIKVEVDKSGNFLIKRWLAGIQFANTQVLSENIIRVEINRAMTAGPETRTGGRRPDTPRFRLDLIHTKGKHNIDASAKIDLCAEAGLLAEALNRPLEKTGDWKS